MCKMCDGMTLEEAVFATSVKVDLYGFGIEVVEAPVSWMYTIGLLHHRDHPEFLIADCKKEPAAMVLHSLGQRVLGGERFEAGGQVVDDGIPYDLFEVHPTRLRAGLCNWWENYDDLYGGHRGGLQVFQVMFPPWQFCAYHASHPMRFDRPGGLPPGIPTGNHRSPKRRSGRGKRHQR
jgi:hypothetical protein